MKGKPSKREAEQRKRRLAEAIMRVRGGLWKANRAARELGISRRTYYKWERRGLTGMMEGLKESRGGRPRKAVDAQKEALRREIERLRKDSEVLRQRLVIQRWMKRAERREGKKR